MTQQLFRDNEISRLRDSLDQSKTENLLFKICGDRGYGCGNGNGNGGGRGG